MNAPATTRPHTSEEFFSGNHTEIIDIEREGLSTEDCAICKESYTLSENQFSSEESDTSILRIVACGHHFHRSCTLAWLKDHSTCPMCRAQLWSARPSVVDRLNLRSLLAEALADYDPFPTPLGSQLTHMGSRRQVRGMLTVLAQHLDEEPEAIEILFTEDFDEHPEAHSLRHSMQRSYRWQFGRFR